MTTLKSIIIDSLALDFVDSKLTLPTHNSTHRPHQLKTTDTYSLILKLLGMFGICSLMALLIFHSLATMAPALLESSVTATSELSHGGISNFQFTNPFGYSIYHRLHRSDLKSRVESKAASHSNDRVRKFSVVDDSDVLFY